MEIKKTPRADIHLKRPMFFSVALVISLSLIITAFEWRSNYSDNNAKKLLGLRDTEELLDIPPTEQLPPPPPKIQQPKIIEVPDEEEIKEEIKVVFDNEVTEETRAEELVITPVVQEKEETDEIFVIVESPPSFVGGEVELRKYVVNNLRYPSQARRMGIEGKVFVECVIERDGSVTQAKTIKGIGAGCDEEAVRVIKSLPNWIPGKQRGHPVRTKIVFPIVFKI